MKKRVFWLEVPLVLFLGLLVFFLFSYLQSIKKFNEAKSSLYTLSVFERNHHLNQLVYRGPQSEGMMNAVNQFFTFKSIDLFKQSLDWNVYFNPSFDFLLHIYAKSKGENISSISKYAAQALYTSHVGSRWFFSPKNKDLQEIEKHLHSDSEFLYSLPVLKKSNLFLSLFFFGWVICVVFLVMYGFNKDGSVQKPRFFCLGSLTVFLMIMWVLCLRIE